MHTNSGVNPFIYAWRFPKYRETFMHLLGEIIEADNSLSISFTTLGFKTSRKAIIIADDRHLK